MLNRSVQGQETLLQFGVSTYPTELTVGYPDPVSLYVTVGRGITQKVLCDGFALRLRIGSGADAWTTDRVNMKPAVRGGTGVNQGRRWVPSVDDDGDWRVFTFTPNAQAVFDGNWDMTLAINNIRLNDQAGQARLEIVETTSLSDGTIERTLRTTVQKAPKDFVLHSFRPDPLFIDNGQTAMLKWEGTRNAAYTLFWEKQQLDLEFGGENPHGQWPTPTLHQTTTFMLQARFTESSGTYWRRLTTTASVNNPDLQVRHLSVAGKLRTDTLAAREGSTIEVRNNLTAAVGTTATFHGPLDVRGDLTVRSATEALGRTRRLARWGPNSQSGSVGFTAETDCLVIGYLEVASANEAGSISVTVGEVRRSVSGGAVRVGSGTRTGHHQIALPVARGTSYTVAYQAESSSYATVIAEFVRVPLGTSADLL